MGWIKESSRRARKNTKSGRPTELGLANVEGSQERERREGGAKKKREGKEERRATEVLKMLGKGCGSKEKSGGGHSPTGKGNRKEPKNAKCTAPSEKQRDVLLLPSQPPRHTHTLIIHHIWIPGHSQAHIA